MFVFLCVSGYLAVYLSVLVLFCLFVCLVGYFVDSRQDSFVTLHLVKTHFILYIDCIFSKSIVSCIIEKHLSFKIISLSVIGLIHILISYGSEKSFFCSYALKHKASFILKEIQVIIFYVDVLDPFGIEFHEWWNVRMVFFFPNVYCWQFLSKKQMAIGIWTYTWFLNYFPVINVFDFISILYCCLFIT